MTQVLAGAEAWSFDGGDVGALVLHGFTGNPSAVRPLAERLAEAGFTVEMPLLPGHGTTWRDMKATTWQDWAREVIDTFELLRQRTRRQVAVGLSMGGTLALHLSEARGDDVAGLVLINPSLLLRDPRTKFLWLLQWLLPSLPGFGSDIADPDEQEITYARFSPRSVKSLMQLQQRVRNRLNDVRVPTLIFTSRQDHVVDPENSEIVLHEVASEDIEQIWLERSYHCATKDYDADLIASRTIAFIERVAGR